MTRKFFRTSHSPLRQHDVESNAERVVLSKQILPDQILYDFPRVNAAEDCSMLSGNRALNTFVKMALLLIFLVSTMAIVSEIHAENNAGPHPVVQHVQRRLSKVIGRSVGE